MKIKHIYLLAVFTLTIILFPNLSSAQEILFGANGNGSPINPGALIQINQLNGIGAFVGDPVTPGGLSGIDFSSAGRLCGSTVEGMGSSSFLVDINPATGALIDTIGEIMDAGGIPIKIGDLAFQPGTDVLFGISANLGPPLNPNGGDLFTIDLNTGIATLVGNTITRACGLCFAPDGTLYCWENNLHILNPNTGQIMITVVTDAEFIDSCAVRADGTIFGSLSGSTANPDRILTVDPITGDLTTIGDSGQGFVSDLAFVEAGLLPQRPIPTLSEWGLIAMAAILGLVGFMVMRRRKVTA